MRQAVFACPFPAAPAPESHMAQPTPSHPLDMAVGHCPSLQGIIRGAEQILMGVEVEGSR